MQSEEFEEIVQSTLDRLPNWVHEALEHVQVVIEDSPGPEFNEEGEDLLGLYFGVPLTERSFYVPAISRPIASISRKLWP